MSFNTLHSLNKRATPKQFTTYRHAILLHKYNNDETKSNDWLNLFFNQQVNNRCESARLIRIWASNDNSDNLDGFFQSRNLDMRETAAQPDYHGWRGT